MKTKVVTLDNKASGEIALSKEIFGLEPREDIIQRVVRWQLAKRQAGTHKVKGRSEVSGTTAKPWKQKGTGRARQGSRRSTQFVGGGISFGPVVRSHAFDLPKKIRKLGLKIALSTKTASGELIVVKDLELANAKSAELNKKLKALGLDSVLIIAGNAVNENFRLASSNLKHVDVLPEQGANVYDILRHRHLVISEEGIKALQERLA